MVYECVPCARTNALSAWAAGFTDLRKPSPSVPGAWVRGGGGRGRGRGHGCCTGDVAADGRGRLWHFWYEATK